tara:strand:- start:73 stop:675 length:603 start_codon:yes stop_codon:yes gene_type:complete
MKKLDQLFNESSSVADFGFKYFNYLNSLLNKINKDELNNFVDLILKARENQSSIFFIGNGGSASTCSHFANDLSIGTKSLDNPIKAYCLNDNIPIMTAIGNDYGFEEIFFQQVKIHLKKNDILVAISASGNSNNLIKAIALANKLGGISVSITGFDGGNLSKISQNLIHIPTEIGDYGPAEDGHLIINHLVSNYLLRKFN